MLLTQHLFSENAVTEIANVEAEQLVLGTCLVNNEALARISFLDPFHFFDPVHQLIFEVIQTFVSEGRLASPITLKPHLQDVEGYQTLGGPEYLVRMAGIGSNTALVDTAKHVRELWCRRDLSQACQDAIEEVRAGSIPQVSSELLRRIAENTDKSGIRPVHRSFVASVTQAIEDAFAAYADDAPPGVATGIAQADRILGSLRPQNLIILAGRPSMGKTMVGMNIAQHVSTEKPVIIASLEMADNEITTRAISQHLREGGTKLPYSRIMRGKFNEDEARSVHDAAREMSDRHKIHFVTKDASQRSALMGAIRASATRLGQPGLVVIDYLQRIVGEKGENDYQSASKASAACKDLARELDCPVLLLSQLSRRIEEERDKRPKMSHLRDSGRIEEDADAIIFAYRDEYYLERAKPAKSDAISDWQQAMDLAKGKLELIVAKNRGGACGTAKVNCEVEHNFIERTPAQEELEL